MCETDLDAHLPISCCADYGPYCAKIPTRVTVGAIHDGIAVDDNAEGTGFIMYSSESVFSRFNNIHNNQNTHMVIVRYHDSKWEYVVEEFDDNFFFPL